VNFVLYLSLVDTKRAYTQIERQTCSSQFSARSLGEGDAVTSLETCLPCICIPVPFADSSVSLNCHCKRFCRQHSPLKSALNGHRALCYWRTCIVYRRLFAGPDVGARIQLQCLLFPVIVLPIRSRMQRVTIVKRAIHNAPKIPLYVEALLLTLFTIRVEEQNKTK